MFDAFMFWSSKGLVACEATAVVRLVCAELMPFAKKRSIVANALSSN